MAQGNQAYAGQRGFTDAGGDFNTLSLVMKAFTGKMQTATLVQVTAIYPGSDGKQGTVDVQLLVNQQDSQGNANPHGVVSGLPYARIQAGGRAIIVDPTVGDIGVAVFASRDISAVKANKKQSNPGSFRRFSYSDGIYLMSALGTTAPTDFIELPADGGMRYRDRMENEITADDTGIVINGVLFPRGGISFNAKTHTHAQDPDSHGDTEHPTHAPTDGS